MQGFTDIFGTFPHATEMKKKYNCKQTAAEKHSVENTTVYSHTFIQKFRESNILQKQCKNTYFSIIFQYKWGIKFAFIK